MFVSSDRFSYGKNLQTYLDKILNNVIKLITDTEAPNEVKSDLIGGFLS